MDEFVPRCRHDVPYDVSCADCVADVILLDRPPRIYVSLEEWQRAVDSEEIVE